MIKVSVIIPVYNVAQFIVSCIDSLMQQTLEDVEYIFVNDSTQDESMELLSQALLKYPNRKDYIKIIEHEQNRGLPAARNTGLSIAKGEYIFHCDSDDYVEPDMLETLYNNAKNDDADIVWCDWFLTLKQNNYYRKQPSYNTSLEAIKGMLTGSMVYNVWNKLVKRELYTMNGITFPDGYAMGEDMTMIMLFAFASKILYVPKAFYHYVKMNFNSYTSSYTANIRPLQYNINRVSSFLRRLYGNSLDREIACMKLEAKLPLLLNGKKKSYEEWCHLFSDANLYILSNASISFRLRCLEWFAWKKQFWIVLLHYWLICKFYYGIRYK
jgi:glycosyltransferase involved in cell wall biosynthesis